MVLNLIIKDIDDFTMDDIILTGYESCNAIKEKWLYENILCKWGEAKI